MARTGHPTNCSGATRRSICRVLTTSLRVPHLHFHPFSRDPAYGGVAPENRDLGVAIASIPLFYAISNISYALFSWPAGRAADAWGTGRILVIGYAFLILAYLVLVASSSPAVLAVGFLLVGIFSAFTDGVQRSHLSHLVEDRYRGTAYGYLNAAVGFGALISGIAGGYVWQQLSDTTALIAAACVIALGLAVFLFGSSKLAPST